METVIIKNYELRITKVSLLRYFATSLFLFITLGLFSQNYTVMHEAFGKSYEFESKGNYSEAISVLKKVYQEDSYEINLRLGWVTYLAGKFTESSAYYQETMKLKPYSIEAKFGFVYPASALGNW